MPPSRKSNVVAPETAQWLEALRTHLFKSCFVRNIIDSRSFLTQQQVDELREGCVQVALRLMMSLEPDKQCSLLSTLAVEQTQQSEPRALSPKPPSSHVRLPSGMGFGGASIPTNINQAASVESVLTELHVEMRRLTEETRVLRRDLGVSQSQNNSKDLLIDRLLSEQVRLETDNAASVLAVEGLQRELSESMRTIQMQRLASTEAQTVAQEELARQVERIEVALGVLEARRADADAVDLATTKRHNAIVADMQQLLLTNERVAAAALDKERLARVASDSELSSLRCHHATIIVDLAKLTDVASELEAALVQKTAAFDSCQSDLGRHQAEAISAKQKIEALAASQMEMHRAKISSLEDQLQSGARAHQETLEQQLIERQVSHDKEMAHLALDHLAVTGELQRARDQAEKARDEILLQYNQAQSLAEQQATSFALSNARALAELADRLIFVEMEKNDLQDRCRMQLEASTVERDQLAEQLADVRLDASLYAAATLSAQEDVRSWQARVGDLELELRGAQARIADLTFELNQVHQTTTQHADACCANSEAMALHETLATVKSQLDCTSRALHDERATRVLLDEKHASEMIHQKKLLAQLADELEHHTSKNAVLLQQLECADRSSDVLRDQHESLLSTVRVDLTKAQAALETALATNHDLSTAYRINTQQIGLVDASATWTVSGILLMHTAVLAVCGLLSMRGDNPLFMLLLGDMSWQIHSV